MVVNPHVELVFCLTHVLFTTHPASNKIHHIFGFAAEFLEYFILVLGVGALK